MNLTTHSPEFWQKFYDDKTVPWDQNTVSQSIKNYFESHLTHLKKNIKTAIVPGCGQGHEVAYINSLGIKTIGLDWATGAIELAQKRYPEVKEQFIQCDFFNLPTELIGQFDLVCEYTFFVAIPPEQRNHYLTQVKKLLKPQGILLGAFMLKNEDEAKPGPPHKLEPNEIELYLKQNQFHLIESDITNANNRREQIIMAQIDQPIIAD